MQVLSQRNVTFTWLLENNDDTATVHEQQKYTQVKGEATLTQTVTERHRFTSWQTTDKNDELSSAHCAAG